ncbi:MAG: 2-hydroxychromene-2-carboxylate isomerase [Burkholderiales bacterium]|nr:2-hydroxychromene-2-carboxylate isomerase [Burkholderiales bacterium]
MNRIVDYYLAPVSPWSYLGHDRFVALLQANAATARVLPVDLSRIFPVSGGLPLPKRAPQRQAYRLVELARWSDWLRIPLNAQPKFVASGGDLASRWILAAGERASANALALAGAVLRARWAEERDIADPVTLDRIARSCGLDAGAIATRADSPEIAAAYDAATQSAIDALVFGVPWYVYRGEPFWGQDRLDFLGRALSK